MGEGDITYSYRDVPTVAAFSDDDTFIRAIIGPLGSGKSSGCVMEIPQRAGRQALSPSGVRKTRWAVVRNTYPQLKDTTIKTFFDWIPPHIYGTYKETAHDFIIDKLRAPDGSPMEIEINFRALDRPDHVRNLLSLEVTGAWFNEVREISKTIFDGMTGRVGRYPPAREGGATWSGIFADTNPPDTDHWFYRLFEVERPRHCNCARDALGRATVFITKDEKCPKCGKATVPSTKIFHQPSGRSAQAENLRNLPAGYYERIMVGKSREWIRVYVDGEYGFLIEGRPVYENWSPALHVPERPIQTVRYMPILMGFDLALHPAAVICQTLNHGEFNVLREFYAEGMGLRRFLRDIVLPHLRTYFVGMDIFVSTDPTGTRRMDTDEKTCLAELIENGLPAIPARSNSLQARINAVDSLLTTTISTRDPNTQEISMRPILQVSPNCELLIRGFNGGYRMTKRMVLGDERMKEEPEKTRESHVHDALQYAAMLNEDGINVRRTIGRSRHQASTPPPAGAYD